MKTQKLNPRYQWRPAVTITETERVREFSRKIVADIAPSELDAFDIEATGILEDLARNQFVRDTGSDQHDAHRLIAEAGLVLSFINVLYATYNFLRNVRQDLSAHRARQISEATLVKELEDELIRQGVDRSIAAAISQKHAHETLGLLDLPKP